MDFIKLSHEVLSAEEAISLVTHPSCGAVSLFIGTTRDNFKGKEVVQLSYEAYQEMAEKEMHRLCTQARERWNLKHIALHHRLGLVPVTESSVIIAVSSEHRLESLDAVSFLIDSLKAKVPIWKKEIYSDGTSNWKRNKECNWTTEDKETYSAMNENETINTNKRSLLEAQCDVNMKPPIKRLKEAEKSTISLGSKPDQDPDLVQITASKQEISRRIAAFQQRKREEIDVLNIEEFCTMSGRSASHNSCARTSAVVLRSKGSSSHLKLTHVVNDWGPQTLGMDPGSIPANEEKDIFKVEGIIRNSSNRSCREVSLTPSLHPTNESPKEKKCKQELVDHQEQPEYPPGIEERLHGLEHHLRIIPGSPVPRNVYSRLKAVEDRVLHLEGLSPEYFRNDKLINLSRKAESSKEIKASEDDLCLSDLDKKIHQLKMKLKHKQIKQES